MSELDTLVFTLQSADFFSVGRALQRAIGNSLLGDVTLEVENQILTISLNASMGISRKSSAKWAMAPVPLRWFLF